MKKFNMFALIALSLAGVANVDATQQGGTQFGQFSTPLPAFVTNQKGALAALRIAPSPTGNNLMARAMSNGTPASALAVSAMGTLKANTKAGTKAKFDSTAFQQGAQVTNEQTSAVAGGMNQMGQNIGASNNVATSMLTGANLKNIAAGSSAPTATSAMSTLTSNTKNSGNVSFKNSSVPRPGFPSTGNVGAFGNVTSKIGLTTQGSSNSMGGSVGSTNNLNLTGNFGPNS